VANRGDRPTGAGGGTTPSVRPRARFAFQRCCHLVVSLCDSLTRHRMRLRLGNRNPLSPGVCFDELFSLVSFLLALCALPFARLPLSAYMYVLSAPLWRLSYSVTSSRMLVACLPGFMSVLWYSRTNASSCTDKGPVVDVKQQTERDRAVTCAHFNTTSLFRWSAEAVETR